MAPVIRILVEWLPNVANALQLPSRPVSTESWPSFQSGVPEQQPIALAPSDHGKVHSMKTAESLLSSISWGKNRLDVFGLVENNVTHKWWDGYQWNPSGLGRETLGNGLATPPVALTWGTDRLDVFGLDDHGTIKHQYWDGTSWQPSSNELENLGGGCDGASTIAANTWGPDRLDIFCRGPEGGLLHQYYDGSHWQPSAGSLESLGGSLSTGPSVVSWGKNRLDIFALNDDDDIVHLYWDGSQWSKWATFSSELSFRHPLTVTSWGENRLDVFAVELDNSLWHLYWDGSQWSIPFEHLGTYKDPLVGSVGVTSHSKDHFDIVGLSIRDLGSHYFHKYYDSYSWQPSVSGWFDKGTTKPFKSNPSVVSWGENRFDIFGETFDGEWLHQAWTGYDWYPGSTEWEMLAGDKEVEGFSVPKPYRGGKLYTHEGL